MAATRAATALDRAGVTYREHQYEVDAVPGDSYGVAVAEALGVEPARVLKTLIASVDGAPIVAVVPVAGSLDLKALAAACRGKRAAMADPADAERLTGYVTGGISPFGQRRRLPVWVDVAAMEWETVFVSGGRRGLQLEVKPGDVVALTGAELARIAG